jgi:hypothetical protein
MPKVINLSGRKPQAVPEGAVYIGRRIRPRGNNRWDLPESKWANPFTLPRNATREPRAEAIAKYEAWLFGRLPAPDGQTPPDMATLRSELRGEDLACWCKPKACHGDVLLRLVELRAGVPTCRRTRVELGEQP